MPMTLKSFASRLYGRPALGRVATADFRRSLAAGLPVGTVAAAVDRRTARRAATLEAVAEILTPRTGRLVRRRLKESCDCADARLAEVGLLRGVTVLTGESRNRRRYSQEAMRKAVPQYENVLVGLDHPQHATDSRSVKDRLGRLVNARFEGGRVKADLRYNKAHPFAPTLKWFSRHDPNALALSHNAVGVGESDSEGWFNVSKIEEIRGVDLVADGGTCRGLFA